RGHDALRGRAARRSPPATRSDCCNAEPLGPRRWGGGACCLPGKNRVKPQLNTSQAQKAVPWERGRSAVELSRKGGSMQRIICDLVVRAPPLLLAADTDDDVRKELQALQGNRPTSR